MQAKFFLLVFFLAFPVFGASPDVCNTGRQQSPIDIRQALPAEKKLLEFAFASNTLNNYNDGHTLRLFFDKGNALTVDGERFDLLEIDFHRPSEHTKEGRAYPMEAQLLFQNRNGQRVHVAVWMIEGMKNKFLQPIFKHIPRNRGDKIHHPGVFLNPKDFLPSDKSAYSYSGSMTAPPCSENVRWFVLQTRVQISGNQLKKFEKNFPQTARPTMALNGRKVLSHQ